MMKTIFYATDFSKSAEAALPLALKIAKANKTGLTLIHIFDRALEWAFPPQENAQETQENIRTSLDKLFEQHKENSGVIADYIVSENISVADGIIALVKERKPELIAIGTRGGSKAKEIIEGSTTRQLIATCPCPVLAVPQNVPQGEFKHIVYATDLFQEDIEAISRVAKLFSHFSPEITIVHISTPAEEKSGEKMTWFKELVTESIAYDKLKFEVLFSQNIHDRLYDYLEQYDVDLLVMLEKKRGGFFDNIFHADLVSRLEFQIGIPILTFTEKFVRGQ